MSCRAANTPLAIAVACLAVLLTLPSASAQTPSWQDRAKAGVAAYDAGNYAAAERDLTAAIEGAGKASGGGTTSISFRDNADSKNRIVATVDSSGNRTAVTLDGA